MALSEDRMSDTPRGTRAPARARTSGRWLTPARLNGIPLLHPVARPHAFRLNATHIIRAGVEANPSEPTRSGARGGCGQLPLNRGPWNGRGGGARKCRAPYEPQPARVGRRQARGSR